MPTLLFGCLLLLVFVDDIPIYVSDEGFVIRTSHLSYYFGYRFTLNFLKNPIPMLIRVPMLIDFYEISHAYGN